MAAAIGIKMPKPAEGGLLAVPTPGDSIPNGESSHSVPEQKPTGFKKSGWATVSSPAAPASGFSRGSGNPPVEPAHLQQPSGGWTKVPAPPPQPPTYESPHFRTGGWSSLDPGPQNTPRPPPPTTTTDGLSSFNLIVGSIHVAVKYLALQILRYPLSLNRRPQRQQPLPDLAGNSSRSLARPDDNQRFIISMFVSSSSRIRQNWISTTN